MNRRQFLSTIFAALIAAPLARLGWKRAVPLGPVYTTSSGLTANPYTHGMTIRLIRKFDPVDNLMITRLDVLYATPALRPQFSGTYESS